MNYIDSNEILKIFKFLNEENIEYILIRNINNELPDKLKIGKDIDILIDYKNKKDIIQFFFKYNFNIVPHPHRNNIYLYGVNKFTFLKNKVNNIIFDLNFQLMCRSLNAGEWIPLDQMIQESAWKNRRFEKVSDDFGYWTLGYNDEFIALVVRSIFDKKEFQDGYINRIEELKNKIDLKDVEEKMKFIFFKFTPFLLEMIEKQEYENIIKNYLQFKEY
jgi:hypothetical protein